MQIFSRFDRRSKTDPDLLLQQIKMCLAGFIFGLFLSVMQMWYCSLEWYFIHERNHYSYFVHEWAHASVTI